MPLHSQPLTALPSQFCLPAGQPTTEQVPLWQTVGEVHTVPQAPQFELSVFLLTSQPLARALLSQFRNGLVQLMLQLPPLHVAVPPELLHASLHAPQCATVVLRLTSQPSAG